MRIEGPARTPEETAPDRERQARLWIGLFGTPYADMNILVGEKWYSIAANNEVAVAVEGRVYIQDFRFLIHVRVFNKTKRRLGIDLRRSDQLIYPNLWQLHRAAERPVIIEARAEPVTVSPALVRKMTADFLSGQLTALTESIDYYCRFNNRPGGRDYSGNERYLTISPDGQLLYADGMSVGRLDLQWREQFGPRQTDVVIPIPFQLSQLPSGALVLDAPPAPLAAFPAR